MMKKIVLILSLLFSVIPVFAETSSCNQLSKEKSPYLLQHKNNPVCWQAWGEEAFLKARKENKPVFLSIGYSTCYWCHVMEKEVFEKENVAKILNEHFISIKVDREERPDVDKVYMEAVRAMTGRGGWPLSAFLNSNKEPFFGGTYFPEEKFILLIQNIKKAWDKEPEKIDASASRLKKVLSEASMQLDGKVLTDDVLKKSLNDWNKRFDVVDGGFGDAPKFPPSVALSSLLRTYRRGGDSRALEIVTTTLEKMAQGGIYDHLGGGFHRYSTDRKWAVPHFEKMLYDNALLSVAYLEAYQVSKKEIFKQVAIETLGYVANEMTSLSGAFYSAQDAGEVGKEGEFYIWDYSELRERLEKSELEALRKKYSLSSKGNFENKNIFIIKDQSKWKDASTSKILKKLYLQRAKREHPLLDDKVLTAWNSLMITAFTKGYQVTGNLQYLNAAKKAALFLKQKLIVNNKLLRRYRDEEARFDAYLDDYAYFIEALIHLYESDFDISWLELARNLQKEQDEIFWDKEMGGYFYSPAKDILVRKKEYYDTAIPSANGTALLNLQRLYGFYFDKEYLKKKEKLFTLFSSALKTHPTAFAKALHALDFELDRAKEIAIISSKKNMPLFFHREFLPNKSLALGMKREIPLLEKKTKLKGKTTFYVCEDRVCKLPTVDALQAKGFAQAFKTIE